MRTSGGLGHTRFTASWSSACGEIGMPTFGWCSWPLHRHATLDAVTNLTASKAAGEVVVFKRGRRPPPPGSQPRRGLTWSAGRASGELALAVEQSEAIHC